MSYLVVVINLPNDSIQTLNDNCQFPTKSYEGVQGVANIVAALSAGAKDGTVQVTTRDSDPSVTTSGADSEQNTYNLS